MPGPVALIVGAESVAYCAEEWGEYERGRLVFSIFSFVVQFILPITLISFAHNAIKKKLQKLPSWQRQAQQAQQIQQQQQQNSQQPPRPSCGKQQCYLKKHAFI